MAALPLVVLPRSYTMSGPGVIGDCVKEDPRLYRSTVRVTIGTPHFQKHRIQCRTQKMLSLHRCVPGRRFQFALLPPFPPVRVGRMVVLQSCKPQQNDDPHAQLLRFSMHPIRKPCCYDSKYSRLPHVDRTMGIHSSSEDIGLLPYRPQENWITTQRCSLSCYSIPPTTGSSRSPGVEDHDKWS